MVLLSQIYFYMPKRQSSKQRLEAAFNEIKLLRVQIDSLQATVLTTQAELKYLNKSKDESILIASRQLISSIQSEIDHLQNLKTLICEGK
jgi:hypothetical protein